MADVLKEFLKNLGVSTFSSASQATHYILIYNNINKNQKTWYQKLSHQDHVQSGTSATLVMLENTPDKAFDPEVLAAYCTKNEWSKLAMKMLCDDVNFSKLTQASIAQILGVIIKHIPSLAHYKEQLMEEYSTKE